MKLKTLSLYLIILNAYSASQPTFIINPTTPTSVNLGLNDVANVSYQVTNNSAISRRLTMIPKEGVTQSSSNPGDCTTIFTLGPKQSCLLNLQITKPVNTGPVICKTKYNNNDPDLNLCSRPSPQNILHIYKNTCGFTEFNSLVSRYPIQVDPNATYYISVISQKSARPSQKPHLIIQDNFPESTYYSISIYDVNGNYYSGIIDNQIPVVAPNINPNIPGNLVLAQPRQFTIDTINSAYLKLPPASQVPEITVVMRNYAPINNQPFVPKPLILEDGLSCGNNESNDSSGSATFPEPLPLPISNPTSDYVNDISFYNIGETIYGDGKSGYLGTSLDPNYIATMEIPTFPIFFNTTNITNASIYPVVETQYISMASYGASLAVNNVIDSNATILDGQSAYYILIPQHWIETSNIYRNLLRNGCSGLNILVLQPEGPPNHTQPYIPNKLENAMISAIRSCH